MAAVGDASTDSGQPQPAPFRLPAPKLCVSGRKQTSKQELQKLADREQDKEKLIAAGKLQTTQAAGGHSSACRRRHGTRAQAGTSQAEVRCKADMLWAR